MRATRFEVTAPPVPLADLGAVHVIGVGGAGMSAVARLCLGAGLRVSGSDLRRSEMTDALAAEGVRIVIGHDAANVAGVDTVVVSSAVREDNPELAAARQAGLRVLHRSQALASTMEGRRKVAVAGANGKTTTTSLLTVALVHAGADPSYAIGGELVGTGTNAHLGAGPAFVVEADESDGSFLAYHPEIAIVTSVQPDHLDFYGTFEAVQEAYALFVDSIQPGGLLVACADDPGAAVLAQAARADGRRVLTYGRSPGADLVVGEPTWEGLAGFCPLAGPGAPEGSVLRIAVPGEYNLLNAAAAFLAATAGLGLEAAAVLTGLASYTGTRRRFEVKGVADGVTVVDDYAHNPGKVAAVVATGRRLAPPGRLIVLFQPHLYSRTRDFAPQLAAGLRGADVAIVLDVYPAREDPIPGVSGALVADGLRGAPGVDVRYVGTAQEAVDEAVAEAAPEDLILTVGAGDVTQLGPRILAGLRERAG